MSRRRLLTIVLPIAVVLAVAVAALAYFSSTGTSTASSSAGSIQNVSLSHGIPSAQLYPGGQADVAVTISNPNPSPVRVASLVLDTSQGAGGFTVDSGHSGCSVSTLSFTAQSNGGAGWSVPAKVGAVDGSLPLDLSAAISMSASAANACQGAAFTVFLEVGP